MLKSLRGSLRGDCVAGLTVWAVLVPEALAYASIAGVSPVVGLYAASGALILYAVFGSSRQLIVGPMAATAALSAAAVGTLAAGNSGVFTALTITVAITVGVIALVAGLLRLGFVANFISEPVMKGFIVGLALTIIIGQAPKLLGVEKGSGNFFQQLWTVLSHLGHTQWRTLLAGLISLAIVLGLRRWLPVVPAPLVAVAVGVLAVYALHLDKHGVKIVGHIDSGLPSFGFPSVPSGDYLKLAGPAVGIMLVGFAEGLGAARTYAAKNGYEISPNSELIGLGAANVAAGLSSGMVVNGSLSKTAVNGAAGARTQVSGLVVAALTILTLLFLTGLFQDLPEATLGAVVIAALIELVDISALRSLYRVHSTRLGRIYGHAARADFIAAAAALLGVLIFDTLPGLFIGISMSLLLLVYRSSRPHVARLGRAPGNDQWTDTDHYPEDTTIPGITVLRVEAGLFFANADYVRTAVTRAASRRPAPYAVILDCETVPFVDVTAARMLDQLTADLHGRGIRLVIAREIGQVRDVLSATGPTPEYFPSVRAAVGVVGHG
ncbi:MAG TPA: SulP family inorganic anion transporter [Streptosporangiaceae bacterium]